MTMPLQCADNRGQYIIGGKALLSMSALRQSASAVTSIAPANIVLRE